MMQLLGVRLSVACLVAGHHLSGEGAEFVEADYRASASSLRSASVERDLSGSRSIVVMLDKDISVFDTGVSTFYTFDAVILRYSTTHL